MPSPTLNAADTALALPMSLLLQELKQAVREYASGGIRCPERLVVPLPQGGVMLSMPAVTHDLAAHKLVNVCPANRQAGQPTIQGLVTAYDALSGRPLFTLDAPTVTARRTAAMSLLGIGALHGPPRHIALIGTGGQARGHIEAMREVYPEARISIIGRDPQKAAQLAREAASQTAEIVPADSVPDEADVVLTTTTSKTPVYDEPPRAGRLVVGVGAFTADAAELSARVVAGSQLYVDDPAGARHEAGDYLLAGVDWTRVHALADALDTSPDADQPTVFKTVGCAAWDLAACRTALQQLQTV